MPDAVVDFEKYRAPWENEDGTEKEQFDKPSLKRYLHNLLLDKNRAQVRAESAETERDTARTELDQKGREGESELERLKREKEAVEKERDTARGQAKESLKLRVALKKGLNEVQAKRLVGETEEELSTDADDLVASFGSKGKTDDDEDETPTVRRQPRRLGTPGDPEPDNDPPLDVNAALDQFYRK